LEQGSVVKLEPQLWMNKTFPLRHHCDVGEKIATGHWIIFFHRAGCSECREATPVVLELAKKKDCSLAVLSMNDYEDSLDFGNIKPLTGLLNQDISWFAETPVVVELDSGVVKQVFLRDELKRMRSHDLQQPLIFGYFVPSEVAK